MPLCVHYTRVYRLLVGWIITASDTCADLLELNGNPSLGLGKGQAIDGCCVRERERERKGFCGWLGTDASHTTSIRLAQTGYCALCHSRGESLINQEMYTALCSVHSTSLHLIIMKMVVLAKERAGNFPSCLVPMLASSLSPPPPSLARTSALSVSCPLLPRLDSTRLIVSMQPIA